MSGIFAHGDRIQTIHGDTGEIVGFLTPLAPKGLRIAAVRLDAGYNIGQSETTLMTAPEFAAEMHTMTPEQADAFTAHTDHFTRLV